MNEMPPSLIEIGINADIQPSEQMESPPKQKFQEEYNHANKLPELTEAIDGDRSETSYNISVEEVRDASKGEPSVTSMELSEIREMEETVKSEKSQLHSTESECSTTARTSVSDQSKSSEDTSKESLLLSVATMNKSLGLLPTNLSCLEPKATKGLSSISFVEKNQLVSSGIAVI